MDRTGKWNLRIPAGKKDLQLAFQVLPGVIDALKTHRRPGTLPGLVVESGGNALHHLRLGDRPRQGKDQDQSDCGAGFEKIFHACPPCQSAIQPHWVVSQSCRGIVKSHRLIDGSDEIMVLRKIQTGKLRGYQPAGGIPDFSWKKEILNAKKSAKSIPPWPLFPAFP